MTNAGLSTIEGSQQGFIDQCEKLNARLTDGHQLAAQIVGPQIADEREVKDTDNFADRLELSLKQALRAAQGLVEQLGNIAQRFQQ